MKKVNKLWNEYTPLMKYAANGMHDLVVRLCEDPSNLIDINEQKGWNKVTALMLAAQNNHTHVIEYLVNKGANIDAVNSLKNSALMLAADAGHYEAVKLLAELGANIGLANEYRHTALILACEKGHLEVVKWLVSKDPKQIEIRNKYHKNCLLMAAEFGQNAVVRWLIEEFQDIEINIETKRGITPLMFAAGGGSDRSLDIVRCLIDRGAEVNKESVEGDTSIIWAAIGGNAGIIQALHAANANINHTNKKGFTALMKAAERGHHKASKALIDAGADMWRVVSDISHHDKRMDAMKLAWMNGHVELATNLFMIPLDKELQMLSRNVVDIFNEDELDELAKKYANPALFKSLKALVVFSCAYDFHFDLFIKLIPRFKTPNTILNKQMIIMYITLFKQSGSYDVELVHKLVQLAAAFAEAAANHPLEKIDLQDRINTIFLMLTECLNSDCMDDERNVQRILCSSISKHEDSVFLDDLVEQAQAFLRGPLETCISAKVTALFCTGHVSTYVDNIFWGFLRTKHGKSVPQFWFTPASLLPFTAEFSKESENIRMFKSVFVHFRFSPAAMFFGEGLSKCMFLFLVAYVSVQVRHQRVAEEDDNEVYTMFGSEMSMLVLTFAMLCYEYGQLCGSTVACLPSFRGMTDYFGDIWNCLDMSGLVLVSCYYVLKYKYHLLDKSLATLSLSTIFFAVSNMRYFSIIETLGKLIIMVFAMLGELRSFAIIFVIFVFGFCITLYCLLSDVEAYQTVNQTLLTLFSMSVQNYDSTFHDLTDKTFGGLALVVQVCYVLLTSVVLINLIIARMSAIHGKIDDKSFEEWQYSRALTVQQFMVVEERSPFCMLPPPFNILPFLVFPVHAWLLSNAAKGITKEESVAAFFKSGGDTFKFAAAMGAGVVTSAVKLTAQATSTVVSTAANTVVNVGGAVADIGMASIQQAGNAAINPVNASRKLASTLQSGASEVAADPAGAASRKLKSIIHNKVASGALGALGAANFGEQIGDTFASMEKFFAAAMEEEEDEQEAPWLKKQVPPVVVSLAGTVCDLQMGIIMSFFAPFLEFLLYQYQMLVKMLPILLAGKLNALLRSGLFREFFIITIAFPLLYFPYVIALLFQTTVYSVNTKVQITRDDDEFRYVVQYDKGKRYEEPEVLSQDADKLSIKVIRMEDLNNCDDSSNPIIKFRIGDLEKCTGPSIYGGKRPTWSKEVVTFPLRSIDVANAHLSYEVVDRDYLTGAEEHIAECLKPIDIKPWLANRSYEGELQLEKGAGKIFVVIKVDFPSFLSINPDPNIPSSAKFGLFKSSKGAESEMGDDSDSDAEDEEGNTKKKHNDALHNEFGGIVLTEVRRPKHLAVQLFSEVDKERIFAHALRPRNKQGYQSSINYFPTDKSDLTMDYVLSGEHNREDIPDVYGKLLQDHSPRGRRRSIAALSGKHATVSGKLTPSATALSPGPASRSGKELLPATRLKGSFSRPPAIETNLPAVIEDASIETPTHSTVPVNILVDSTIGTPNPVSAHHASAASIASLEAEKVRIQRELESKCEELKQMQQMNFNLSRAQAAAAAIFQSQIVEIARLRHLEESKGSITSPELMTFMENAKKLNELISASTTSLQQLQSMSPASHVRSSLESNRSNDQRISDQHHIVDAITSDDNNNRVTTPAKLKKHRHRRKPHSEQEQDQLQRQQGREEMSSPIRGARSKYGMIVPVPPGSPDTDVAASGAATLVRSSSETVKPVRLGPPLTKHKNHRTISDPANDNSFEYESKSASPTAISYPQASSKSSAALIGHVRSGGDHQARTSSKRESLKSSMETSEPIETLQKGSQLDDLDMDGVDSGGAFGPSNVKRAPYALTPRSAAAAIPTNSADEAKTEEEITIRQKSTKSKKSNNREGFLNIARIVNGRNVVSKARIVPDPTTPMMSSSNRRSSSAQDEDGSIYLSANHSSQSNGHSNSAPRARSSDDEDNHSVSDL